jgi:hypothetical protein
MKQSKSGIPAKAELKYWNSKILLGIFQCWNMSSAIITIENLFTSAR